MTTDVHESQVRNVHEASWLRITLEGGSLTGRATLYGRALAVAMTPSVPIDLSICSKTRIGVELLYGQLLYAVCCMVVVF